MAKTDDTPPLVSVIIPTYRRGTFLPRAIESVLAQTYSPVEVIVVEDGSHEARGVVSSFGERVTYLWQENQGAAVARNTGAAAARGAWIALLDDDDFWVPDKLERQFELLRAFPPSASSTPTISGSGTATESRAPRDRSIPCRRGG
jgi:glycosyltransferase involved in cell wall biosynthesis